MFHKDLRGAGNVNVIAEEPFRVDAVDKLDVASIAALIDIERKVVLLAVGGALGQKFIGGRSRCQGKKKLQPLRLTQPACVFDLQVRVAHDAALGGTREGTRTVSDS